jgi:hypothetical protein
MDGLAIVDVSHLSRKFTMKMLSMSLPRGPGFAFPSPNREGRSLFVRIVTFRVRLVTKNRAHA